MSMDDFKKGWNTNSSISVGLGIVIMSAALWLNSSIGELKTGQVKQETALSAMSAMMQVKVDAVSARIDAMGARIDGLVTRPELDAKVTGLELQILKSQWPPSGQNRVVK